MTTNQLTITNDQVKSLIQIRKSLARGNAGTLQDNKAFLDFLAIQQQVTEEINATWDVVKELMLAHDIKGIKGDWGHVSMSERKTFSIAKGEKPAPRFIKPAIDSDIVKAYMKLHDEQLPAGVKLSISSPFLTKKVKAL